MMSQKLMKLISRIIIGVLVALMLLSLIVPALG